MTFVSYAQNYEDVRLWRALRDVHDGRYLDIGAQDPVVDSVSLAFYERGWRGTHVEPTATYAAALREARPDEDVIEAAVSAAKGPIEFFEFPDTGLSTGLADIADRHRSRGYAGRRMLVPTVRLDSLLDRAQQLHWLKIDVEGMEADVLASWGEHPARPWIVLIEATAPMEEQRTVDRWRDELLRRDYHVAGFDGLSEYFVHASQPAIAERLTIPANVFDRFAITAQHFSASGLTAKLAGVRGALDQATAAGEEARRRLGEAIDAHRVATTDLERLRERHDRGQAELAAAERRHGDTLARLSAAEQEHRAALTRFDAERREAASRLQDTAVELATFRERSAQLAERNREQARQAAEQLRDARAEAEARIQQANATFAERLQGFQGELAASTAQHAAAAAALARAEQIIAQALAAPRSRWHRFGRALGLTGDDASRERLRQWAPPNLPPPPAPHLPPPTPSPTGEVQLPSPSHSPAPSSDAARNPYLRADSLAELVAWSDVDFVRCAYVTILGRQPDEAGEAVYTAQLRRGISKLEILWALRRSKEAAGHDPGIAGLDRALRQAANARRPLVGWMFRRPNSFESNRAVDRSHRALMNELNRLRGEIRALPTLATAGPVHAPSAAVAHHGERTDTPALTPPVPLTRRAEGIFAQLQTGER